MQATTTTMMMTVTAAGRQQHRAGLALLRAATPGAAPTAASHPVRRCSSAASPAAALRTHVAPLLSAAYPRRFFASTPATEQLPQQHEDEAAANVNPLDTKMLSTKEGETRPLSQFPLSDNTKRALEALKIHNLFAIQVATFMPLLEGKDVVGRARTGTGKTLAFALPIVENISKLMSSGIVQNPRLAKCIVMAPTRELARQIAAEFSKISKLRVVCLYGGAPLDPQMKLLNRGVDIIVGTPGRVTDLYNRQAIGLSEIRTVVLDEADHMLDIGFQDAIEEILGHIKHDSVGDIQTVLFSATIPSRLKGIISRNLKPDGLYIDQISKEDTQAAKTVTHYAIPYAQTNDAAALISNAMDQLVGPKARAIIFTNRKVEADELARELKILRLEALALHGDVTQRVRDVVMDRFRSGQARCLVATDVAARGLDVPNVDAVFQMDPPSNVESYIHRSGRTGRAGKKGVSVLLFAPKDHEGDILEIENKAALKLRRIRLQPAQPSHDAAGSHQAHGRRRHHVAVSLLSGDPEVVTMMVNMNQKTSLANVNATLSSFMASSVADEVSDLALSSVRLTASGFVFDVPEQSVQDVLQKAQEKGLDISEVYELPELVAVGSAVRSPSRIGVPPVRKTDGGFQSRNQRDNRGGYGSGGGGGDGFGHRQHQYGNNNSHGNSSGNWQNREGRSPQQHQHRGNNNNWQTRPDEARNQYQQSNRSEQNSYQTRPRRYVSPSDDVDNPNSF